MAPVAIPGLAPAPPRPAASSPPVAGAPLASPLPAQPAEGPGPIVAVRVSSAARPQRKKAKRQSNALLLTGMVVLAVGGLAAIAYLLNTGNELATTASGPAGSTAGPAPPPASVGREWLPLDSTAADQAANENMRGGRPAPAVSPAEEASHPTTPRSKRAKKKRGGAEPGEAEMAAAPPSARPPTAPAADDAAPPAAIPAAPMAKLPQPTPATPAAGADSTPPTKAEVEQLVAELKAARLALTELNFAEAKPHLARAAALAKLPSHREAAARLQELAGHAERFQSAIAEAVQGLKSGESFRVGTSTEVAFVEAPPGKVTLRVGGMNRTYPIAELPAGLALALADLKLPPSDPATKLAKGAYLALHKVPDPSAKARDEEKAKALWKEAASEGADAARLEAALADNYDSLMKEAEAK